VFTVHQLTPAGPAVQTASAAQRIDSASGLVDRHKAELIANVAHRRPTRVPFKAPRDKAKDIHSIWRCQWFGGYAWKEITALAFVAVDATLLSSTLGLGSVSSALYWSAAFSRFMESICRMIRQPNELDVFTV